MVKKSEKTPDPVREAEKIHREDLEQRITPVPQYSGEDVKKLRKTLNVGTGALALLLNVQPALVKAWERGAKSPDGPCCKLLSLLERRGVEHLL